MKSKSAALLGDVLFSRHLSHSTFHTAAIRLLSVHNIPRPTADPRVGLPGCAEKSSAECCTVTPGEQFGKRQLHSQRSGCSCVKTSKPALTGLVEAPLPVQSQRPGAGLPRVRIKTDPHSLC